MRVLIIHKGFPGQFKHLIPKLQERGDKIFTICSTNSVRHIPKDVRYATYKPVRGNGDDTFPLAKELETKVIRGEAVANTAERLSKEGFKPNIILGHPGWGEMLFLADIWPDVPQLHYVEFFYGVNGTDNDIQDEYTKPQTWEVRAKARIKNTNLLVNLNQMNAGICPTNFQHSLLPIWAQKKTKVIHDGIDTEWLCPDINSSLSIKDGPTLKRGDPIITFMNRTFEPYRGVHIFLKALVEVQNKNPDVQTILVGTDTPKISYGERRSDNKGWLTVLRNQLGNQLDWSRIHELGHIKHSKLRLVYQISSAHVYLSYPFVLSWSLLEAMSSGALVIGSATPSVEELIEHNQTGILVPFHDSKLLSEQLIETLKYPKHYTDLRMQARLLIREKYNLPYCLEKQLKEIDLTAAGSI